LEILYLDKNYSGFNHESRVLVAILSSGALIALCAWNKIKVDWTNNFYNKLLRKEVVSDHSTYYHFSLNIIGEDDSDWIQDKVIIKKKVFFNF
jgi:hypothetical protein